MSRLRAREKLEHRLRERWRLAELGLPLGEGRCRRRSLVLAHVNGRGRDPAGVDLVLWPGVSKDLVPELEIAPLGNRHVVVVQVVVVEVFFLVVRLRKVADDHVRRVRGKVLVGEDLDQAQAAAVARRRLAVRHWRPFRGADARVARVEAGVARTAVTRRVDDVRRPRGGLGAARGREALWLQGGAGKEAVVRACRQSTEKAAHIRGLRRGRESTSTMPGRLRCGETLAAAFAAGLLRLLRRLLALRLLLRLGERVGGPAASTSRKSARSARVPNKSLRARVSPVVLLREIVDDRLRRLPDARGWSLGAEGTAMVGGGDDKGGCWDMGFVNARARVEGIHRKARGGARRKEGRGWGRGMWALLGGAATARSDGLFVA